MGYGLVLSGIYWEGEYHQQKDTAGSSPVREFILHDFRKTLI
jgi:hypothetical protein